MRLRLGPRSCPSLVALFSATVATATPAAQCADAASMLHLVLMDEAHADRRIVDTAMQEVDRIWGGGQLQLIWITPEEASTLSPDEPVITMVIHPSLAPLPPGTGHSSHHGSPLGRLRYDEQRHLWNSLDVSFSGITSIVMASSVVRVHVTDLPLAQQRLLLGRALGRVIAHEIGHWRWGPMHVPDGLMKPQLADHELIDPRPPPLANRCPR